MNNYGIDHAVLQMKQLNYMHTEGEFMVFIDIKLIFWNWKCTVH